MHPRFEELTSHLLETRAALKSAVDAVPFTARRRVPPSGGWSIAGVVHHLSVVERIVARVLGAQIEAARAGGLGPERETGPLLPTIDDGWVVDRERKIAAPTNLEPPVDVTFEAAWAVLEQSRAALLQVVREADGLAIGEIVFPHPVAGPLNGYEWLAFVGHHETRHAAQVREIAAAVGS